MNIIIKVSVSASELGCIKLVFVELGVKIDNVYCQDVLLTQNCCQQSVTLQAKFTCFTRTVCRHIVDIKPSSFCVKRLPLELHLTTSELWFG